MIPLLKAFFQRLVADAKDLLRLLTGQQPRPVSAPPTLRVPAPKEIDWDVWEDQQIARGGYVWWFDRSRYDGTPWAYPEPKPRFRVPVPEWSAQKHDSLRIFANYDPYGNRYVGQQANLALAQQMSLASYQQQSLANAAHQQQNYLSQLGANQQFAPGDDRYDSLLSQLLGNTK